VGGAGAADLDGWMSLWAEGAVQMPDDAPTRVGKSRIREGMKPAFDGMDMSITIHGIQDVDVWGDHGMTRCTYSLTLTPKGGDDRIDAMPDGKALTLYERQSDGTWKIVCDCFNSNV
jgi:ketosteroid isomerase-like protein